MTWQERATPESDSEFLLDLDVIFGGNKSAMAQEYGVTEGTIRKRIKRIREDQHLQALTDEFRKYLIVSGKSVDEAYGYQVKRVTNRGN